MDSRDSASRDSDDGLVIRFRNNRLDNSSNLNGPSSITSPSNLLINDSRDDGNSRSDTPIIPNQTNSSTNTRFNRPSSILDFFTSEVTRGYALENDEARFSEKRKKVYAFIKVPRELESFLFYGFLQCTDAFLYIFTLLPIRFFLGLWHFSARSWRRLKRRHSSGNKTTSSSTRILSPSEMCDLLKILIIITATLLMTFIDTSWMYHVVRGQAVIKLYIFYNMLEVADKLFSSFGQDILDALFWTATQSTVGYAKSGASSRRSHLDQLGMGTLAHLFIAILYVFGHTILVLFQATTLNVAFNSHNKALLTIMMSNNFVELKGSVFKKFAKNNLFQMACSDVRERFHILILLSVVVVRNMTAVKWRAEHFWEMVPDLAMVVFGEFLVDWLKHAFITKFNEIPHEVYKDFTITIAYDVARSREKTAFSDHSDQVSRRMGFIPLPLGVLMIQILSQSLSKYLQLKSMPWYKPSILILFFVCYAALLSLKLLISIILLGEACKHIETYEEMQKQADLLKRLRKQKAKSVPASPKLSLLEFNDVMQQTHPVIKGLTVCDVLQQAAEELAQFSKEQQNTPESIMKSHRRSKSVVQLSTARSRHVSEMKEAAAIPTASPPPGEKSAPGGVLPDQLINEGGVIQTKIKSPVSECESLQSVDRYTLCNDDRIVS